MWNQVTKEDFKAPEGKYRMIREEMSDGKVSIVGDFGNPPSLVVTCLLALREHFPQDMFSLWDDQGKDMEADVADTTQQGLWDRDALEKMRREAFKQ